MFARHQGQYSRSWSHNSRHLHAQGTTPWCGCVVCPSDAEPSRTIVIGVSSDGGRAIIGSGRVPSAVLGRFRPWFAPPRTWERPWWRGSRTVSAQCSVNKVALWPGCPCPPRLQTLWVGSIHTCSGFSCSAACGCPSPSLRQYRCGRPLDAMPEQGSWGGVASQWRVQEPESAARREARVVANDLVHDFDLVAPNPRDQRRLEILADGIPLIGGSTCRRHNVGVASPLWRAVLAAARRWQERTYPELSGPRSRARLVVLVGEIGGRWGFCLFWQRRRPGRNPQSWRNGRSKRGGYDGAPFWASLQSALLQHLCWSSGPVVVPMGTSRPRTRWLMIIAMLAVCS